jgi:hypothetical protein
LERKWSYANSCPFAYLSLNTHFLKANHRILLLSL